MTTIATLTDATPTSGFWRTTRAESLHTVWGLDPLQLHARFWAARGIQVVRQGERSEIIPHAELYLLADPRTIALFRITEVTEQLAWLDSEVLFLRLADSRDHGYRELAETDGHGRFVRFVRDYGGGDSRLARVGITPERDVARLWQSCSSPREGWRTLRRRIPHGERWTMSVNGRVYDRKSEEEVAAFVRDLVQTWHEPDSTIRGIQQIARGVWGPAGTKLPSDTKYRAPLWIGAGRDLPRDAMLVGPVVMWDRADVRPVPQAIQWLELQPSAQPVFNPPRPRPKISLAAKRAFDIVFSLIALILTLPLYPFIALAIVLEDPGPVFFVHTRECKGGREFGCIKFRSMKVGAEQMKSKFQSQNVSDGPHVFIKQDPRATRVGRIMRKCQLDEIPQFLNVLKGEMSIVGPRPSPYKENQYSPPWREARLSVKPGVTGLWQVKRTRATGSDFQEWIKYDIEYVERASFWLDMWILWHTVRLIIKGIIRA
jgi:lipopolysaccharide/colanic/teichoic acid biosynthesis glycosyltransferase